MRISALVPGGVIRLGPLTRYGIAVAAAAASTILRLALDPLWGEKLPLILFFPAIMVSAWLGGFGPGILATVLCALTADYFWMAPHHAFTLDDPADLVGLLVFVAVGAVISGLNEAWRVSASAVVESEERLRVTLGSIGDAVLTTDEQGCVTGLNAVGQALTGWTEAEALGRPLEDVFVIIQESSRRRAENPVHRVLREGVIAGLANHTVLISKGGREIPVDDSAAPIRTADGRVAGVVMVFRDITERRRVERDRAAVLENERSARAHTETAEQHLRLALEAGRMGTWLWTVGTGEVRWSSGLEAIHGFAPGTFPGTFEAVQKEIHPEDRERVLQAITEAVELGREHHVEYRIIRSDGDVRWVEGRGRLFRDAEGRPERMVGVCSDVTERRHAEERERQAKRDAEEANRAKDEFLAVLSHELRTPLSSVLGWASILKSGALSPEQASHALEVIERNARAEVHLVDSLLDLSRIVAGKLELDRERVDLAPVVRAAVDALRPAADARSVTLDVVVPRGPMTILGDGNRLQQVVWNLLSNAVKFSLPGGLVRVILTCEGSRAQIQVSDDGEGISPEFLPHIFDRFRQAESAKGRTYGGLGLGLAIVRELVHAHGGTVVADSPGKGRGSTFTVTLRLASAAGEHEATTDPAPTAEEPSILGLRVLVVDDAADVREVVALTLQSRGALVRMASSAGEALESIRSERPDVLLADIGMPQEDGYTLIQRLRAQEHELPQKRLPAIALTAYASAADREQALAAGYDLHLKKPVEPRELAFAVARFLKAERA